MGPRTAPSARVSTSTRMLWADVPPATLQVVISPQEAYVASLTGEPRWGVVPVTIDELGFVPLSPTMSGTALRGLQPALREGLRHGTHQPPLQRVDRRASARSASPGALLDRLTHHVHILEMNGESYRLKCSRENAQPPAPDDPDEE